MKLLTDKEYDNLLQYKAWHENLMAQINKEGKTANMFKVDCCDFCFYEHMKFGLSKLNIMNADYEIPLNNKKIRICKKHVIELRDACQNIIVKDPSIHEN